MRGFNVCANQQHYPHLSPLWVHCACHLQLNGGPLLAGRNIWSNCGHWYSTIWSLALLTENVTWPPDTQRRSVRHSRYSVFWNVLWARGEGVYYFVYYFAPSLCCNRSDTRVAVRGAVGCRYWSRQVCPKKVVTATCVIPSWATDVGAITAYVSGGRLDN